MTAQMIRTELLDVAAANVRRAGVEDGLDQMVASIKAYGVLMPLLVKANGDRFDVIDGQRRLLAARRAALEAVPCTVTTAEAEAELSLTANATQMPMRPGDQYRAFAACLASAKPAEIAKRFGVTKKFVEQRLKLADLAPEVLALLDEGVIGVEMAEVLTTTSREFQTGTWLPAFEKKEWWAENASQLRQRLLNVRIPAKLAMFDLKASGLTVVRDLFDKDDGGYVTDVDGFLAKQRAFLDAKAEEMRAEWGAVEVVMGSIDYNLFLHRDPSEPKSSGVVLVLRETGEVITRSGLVRRADAAAKAAAEGKPTPAETRAETRRSPTHVTASQDAEFTQTIRNALREVLVEPRSLHAAMAIAIRELGNAYDGPQVGQLLNLPEAELVRAFQAAVANRLTAQVMMPDFYRATLAHLGHTMGEFWHPSPDWLKGYGKDQLLHFIRLYDPQADLVNADAKREALIHRLLSVLPEGWVPPRYVPPAEGESPFEEEPEGELAEAA